MYDIEELAFQIARYMHDNKYTGSNIILVKEIREVLNLSPEEFDSADDYLREMKYYEATFGGDLAQLSLTAKGINFVSRITSERINLPRDVEQLAIYLSNKQSANKTFVVDTEIMTDLQWDNKRYWNAGEILVDENLAKIMPRSDQTPFKGLSLNGEGRKAVRNNFRKPTSSVNLHTGDNYSVENSGSNVVIAAGQNNTATQNLINQEFNFLFDEITQEIERRRDLSSEKKQAIKNAVELAQEESKAEKPNEKRLTAYFQNIGLMAPDILEVAVAAASTSIVGPIPLVLLIAKKVAEKIKEDAQSKPAG